MRLEGQIKMGYYPTPLSIVERVRSFLRFPKEAATIFDPCCGEGLAVKGLVESTDAVTYGVELDKKRAEEAKSNLNHVLPCGYEEVRITNNAFSILWLNPPYDFERNDEEDDRSHDRKEKTFLANTLKYLKPGGILIYIIPQVRLTKQIAKLLSSRFQDIRVYRFPEEEYKAFGQIVVLGIKKPRSEPDDAEYLRLAQVPDISLDETPMLSEPIYDFPLGNEISLFVSTKISIETVEKEVTSSPLWKRMAELSLVHNGLLNRPPLPLHAGHLGLLLASGCLDGLVGQEDDQHVVRGKVIKTIDSYEEMKGDVTEIHEVESYQVTIKILTRTGDLITLM